MSNQDGTLTCGHEGCNCRVADTQSHIREDGKIYCSPECRDGQGCNCEGCSCGNSKSSD